MWSETGSRFGEEGGTTLAKNSGVVRSWVKTTQCAKFDLRYESLKSKFSLILFAYNPMIGYSKKHRELSERVLLIKRKRNPG